MIKFQEKTPKKIQCHLKPFSLSAWPQWLLFLGPITHMFPLVSPKKKSCCWSCKFGSKYRNFHEMPKSLLYNINETDSGRKRSIAFTRKGHKYLAYHSYKIFFLHSKAAKPNRQTRLEMCLGSSFSNREVWEGRSFPKKIGIGSAAKCIKLITETV